MHSSLSAGHDTSNTTPKSSVEKSILQRSKKSEYLQIFNVCSSTFTWMVKPLLTKAMRLPHEIFSKANFQILSCVRHYRTVAFVGGSTPSLLSLRVSSYLGRGEV
jgi:hypothetical protein